MTRPIRIALDGPSGAGKSSLAKQIAKTLDILYLDTGALYRTVGLYVKRKNKDPYSESEVAALLPEITISVKFDRGQRVFLCGEDVTDLIRTPEISKYASAVSAHPCVREFLLDIQRQTAAKSSVIMDGRDIGTVIMPDADVKLFLTASAERRAERRWKELLAKGEAVEYDDVLRDIIARDAYDSGRAIAPASQAPDAQRLDNSDMTEKETLEEALKQIRAVIAQWDQ